MSKLIQAMNNNTTTTNGMAALKSSLNYNVDLFFQAGASRGKDIIPLFKKALEENQDYAIRIMQWLRDVRGGAGERQLFRDTLQYLVVTDYETTKRILHKIPELGRWDDLQVLLNSPLENEMFALYEQALNDKNGLAAKWCPRKGEFAAKFRKYLGWTPKFYRKTIVGLSNTVEQKMCANQWTEIEYGKLPSVASARYQKAFGRHDQAGYAAYIQSLQKGEAKINAGAVYPYDVVKSLKMGNKAVANEQWKALPDYVGNLSFLPVVDVSGSMMCPVGGNPSVTCLDVAVSLGLYLSERNKSVFKDAFVTFSKLPTLQHLQGTLEQRYNALATAHWQMNTDVQAVFQLVLDSVKRNNLSQEDIPDYLVILSDMQFDAADRHGDTAYKMAQRMFKDEGLECPQLIFWNLNAHDNTPVSFSQKGAALVSGCSPSIMQAILGGKELTPVSMMLEVIMNERYDY